MNIDNSLNLDKDQQENYFIYFLSVLIRLELITDHNDGYRTVERFRRYRTARYLEVRYGFNKMG